MTDGRVSMFCSMGTGIGQTTALVRVGLQLSESPQRVLIVDANHGPVRGLLGRESAGSGVRTVRLSAQGGRLDLTEVDGFAGLARFTPPPDYDHVLVDAPVAQSDADLDQLVGLPQTIVVSLSLSPWSQEGTVEFIRRLMERASPDVGLVVVGIQPEQRFDAVDNLRQQAQYHQYRYLEIPHAPEYAAGTHVIDPNQGRDQHVHDAYYARLATQLGGAGQSRIGAAIILYSPPYLAWAEWISVELIRAGQVTSLVPIGDFAGEPPPSGTIVLAIWPCGISESAAERVVGLSPTIVRLILVDDAMRPAELVGFEATNLAGLTEREAATRLHRELGLSLRSWTLSPVRRFPRVPAYNNLAQRNTAFVGRDQLINELREELRGAAAQGAGCVLWGAPGSGKSEIVLEYCYRHGGDYAAIWWLSGSSPERIRADLAEVANRLDLTVEGDLVEAVRAALAARQDEGWLLVVDDLRGQESAELLVPLGRSSRLLVTARAAEPQCGQIALRPVKVPSFALEESRTVLQASLPRLPRDLADRIGHTVGHLPLAVHMAAALLRVQVRAGQADNAPYESAVTTAVERFGEEYRTAQAELLAGTAQATSAHVMLEVTVRNMFQDPQLEAWSREDWNHEGGGAALQWIVDACALLDSRGVTLDLLRSPGLQRALTGHLGAVPPVWLSDPLMIDVAVWSLAQHGLVEVDPDHHERPIRQHATLRELITQRMSAERRARLTAELWLALSEYAPSRPTPIGPKDAVLRSADRMREPVPGHPFTPKDPDSEVRRNLVELRSWKATDPGIRRWLVYRLFDLVQVGDKPSLDLVLSVGLKAKDAWSEGQGEPEYLRLLNLLAQAYRLLGDYEKATSLTRRALRLQRIHLGAANPRTLLTADAYASILRAAGEFGEAQMECRNAARHMADLLGPDHSSTVQIEHNLALSEVLVGNAAEALRIARYRFERGRVVGGNPRITWRFALAAAAYHRALGHYRESHILLKDYLAHSGESGVGTDLLIAEAGLAITERRLGQPEDAHERDTRLLSARIRITGEQSLDTLSCRSSLAADLIALGKYAEAEEEATRSLHGMIETMGPTHPFSQIPQMQISICLRSHGALEEARARAESALETLSARLADPHPWVLSARVNLASVLVRLGELDAAAALEQSAVSGFDDLNDPYHPGRSQAVDNLKDTTAPDGSFPARRREIDLEIPGI
jgi:tetratricopeptide (TPR) repeat protein